MKQHRARTAPVRVRRPGRAPFTTTSAAVATALRSAVAPAALALLSGCATAPVAEVQPPFPPALVGSLGTVAAVPDPAQVPVAIHQPVRKGKAIGNGMSDGFEAGMPIAAIPFAILEAGASSGDGDAALGALAGFIYTSPCLLAPPLFAVVGGTAGAVTGVPAEDLDAASAAVNQTVDGLHPQADLAVALERQVGQVWNEVHTASVPLPPPGKHFLQPLASAGVDTALVVRVTGLELKATRAGANPPLALHFDAEVRVFDIDSHRLLYRYRTGYTSEPRKFVEWGESQAQPLAAELEQAVRSISDDITYQIFVQPRAAAGTAIAGI